MWHYRLGYPSFFYLRHLFRDLFKNKNPSLFQCEFCEFAKHHGSSFPFKPYNASKPFVLMHSDFGAHLDFPHCPKGNGLSVLLMIVYG